MTENPRSTDRTRTLLWVVLVVCAALNAVTSTINPFLGAAFGVVVLACVVALILRWRRTRH